MNDVRLPSLDDVGPIRRRGGQASVEPFIRRVFLLPLVPVFALVLIPVGNTLWQALQAGGFGSSQEEPWVWANDGLWAAWARTVAWVLLCFAVMVAGVAAALIARRVASRWPELQGPLGSSARALLIAPAALPLVVLAICLRLLFHPDPGRRLLPGWLAGPAAHEGWSTTGVLMLGLAWAWIGLMAVACWEALKDLGSAPHVVDLGGKKLLGSRRLAVVVEAYWQPKLRRVAAVVILPMLLMVSRMLELVLVGSPPSVEGTDVLALLHWRDASGRLTPSSAAIGVLWWLTTVAVVALVVAVMRPRWAHSRGSPGGDGRIPVTAASVQTTATTGPEGPEQAAPARGRRPATRERFQILGRPVREWMVAVLRWCMAFVWLIPLGVLVLTAFAPPHQAVLKGWRGASGGSGSFPDLLDSGFPSSFRLNLGVAVVVTVAAVVLAVLIAAALDDVSPPSAKFAVGLLAVAAVVPVQVIAGPMHSVFDRLESLPFFPSAAGLRLALAHIALTVPLGVVVLYAAGGSVLSTVRSAWRSDRPSGDRKQLNMGAGKRDPLWREKLRAYPVVRTLAAVWAGHPAVVAAAVLIFVMVWNDFAVGLLFAGRSSVPLAVFLFGQTRQLVLNSGQLAAGAVVMAAVPMVVLAVFHRKVIDGLVGATGGQPRQQGGDP